jgi:acetyl-CoA carboxylase carboxyl transferase subunit beta
VAERDARSAIAAVAKIFAEFDYDEPQPGPDGPLGWPGYDGSLDRARDRTGEFDSVVTGLGKIGERGAVIIAFDFRFFGGSIGGFAGYRITQAFHHAATADAPVVSLIASGGSRMQEGMRSLHQLQRIALARAGLVEDGRAHIAVLRNPTTGGIWAALGAGADVIIAVRGAQVGFAGSRVRPAELVDHLAYTAADQLASGQVDEVVDESELRDVLAEWLELLPVPDFGRVEPAPVPRPLGERTAAEDGWSAVQRARSRARPRANAYLDDYFQTRRAISGDRCGGVDSGMLCGIGRRDGRSIAYAAQTGTANTPAGFRTATRLIRLAERFQLPVLTLVDTPGAAADPAAERAGLGPALAELFGAVASEKVPVTTLVIGEGGSGGALAMASPDNTWITPDAYFSVIAPELAAAILKRDAAEVPVIAGQLRLRPQDLVELRVVRGIAGA